ncbi:MAG: hypothetical protein J0I90_10480, partial [Nitrosospira sp.]|nr:hypothetical protein [Nitrosospira sp.]
MSRNIFALTRARSARAAIPRLIAVSLAILSPPVYSAPQANEEDLKHLRGRIETLQKALAETEESQSEAANALRRSE